MDFANGLPRSDCAEDDEVFEDVSETASDYLQFAVFDDVCAVITDGVVTVQGKMTMLGKTAADALASPRAEQRPGTSPAPFVSEPGHSPLARCNDSRGPRV